MPWVLISFATNIKQMPLQISHYLLLTLLSSVVIMAYGFQLLLNVPGEKDLTVYRFSRRVLAAAYLSLASLGILEIFLQNETSEGAVVSSFTLVIAGFQAFLFTFALMALIRPDYITRRLLGVHFGVITLVSAVLLISLFGFGEMVHTVIFRLCLVGYVGQLVWYVRKFRQIYGEGIRRLSDFYAEDEDRRLHWINRCFYMALTIGILALVGAFMRSFYYHFFIPLYTVFYVYFAVKYCNYVPVFHYVLRGIALPSPALSVEMGDTEDIGIMPEVVMDTAEKDPSNVVAAFNNKQFTERLQQWIENKKYLETGKNLSDVAEELGTNRSYFSRYLNTHEECDFRNWRSRLRIEEASRLLLIYPDKSVSGIAEMVGFSDRSNFHRQFTTIIGMSPQNYRKNRE